MKGKGPHNSFLSQPEFLLNMEMPILRKDAKRNLSFFQLTKLSLTLQVYHSTMQPHLKRGHFRDATRAPGHSY